MQMTPTSCRGWGVHKTEGLPAFKGGASPPSVTSWGGLSVIMVPLILPSVVHTLVWSLLLSVGKNLGLTWFYHKTKGTGCRWLCVHNYIIRLHNTVVPILLEVLSPLLAFKKQVVTLGNPTCQGTAERPQELRTASSQQPARNWSSGACGLRN